MNLWMEVKAIKIKKSQEKSNMYVVKEAMKRGLNMFIDHHVKENQRVVDDKMENIKFGKTMTKTRMVTSTETRSKITYEILSSKEST